MKKVLLIFLVIAIVAMTGCTKPEDGKDGAKGDKGEQGERGPEGPTNTFTLTFNYDDGSPLVTQTVLGGGWAKEPKLQGKTAPEGLYQDEVPIYGWVKDGETNLFNFDKPIIANATLTAKFTHINNPIDVSGQAGANIVIRAIAYARANAAAGKAFTLAIDNNYDVGGLSTINTANFNLTIIGLGAEYIIQYSGTNSSRLFYLNNSNANLTLGNNITLKGIATSTVSLVWITSGIFTMEAGSKITGHTTTEPYGTVNVDGANSRFMMNGGEISGNKSASNYTFAAGGVWIASSATFAMSDGKISGNTFGIAGGGAAVRPSDISIANNVGTVTLSGAAVVGTIKLSYLTSANGSITVDNYNPPSKPVIDLVSNNSAADAIGTVKTNWLGKTVLKAVGSLTAADITKFNLGLFIASDNIATEAISNTYKIADSGADIGKLVAK